MLIINSAKVAILFHSCKYFRNFFSIILIEFVKISAVQAYLRAYFDQKKPPGLRSSGGKSYQKK